MPPNNSGHYFNIKDESQGSFKIRRVDWGQPGVKLQTSQTRHFAPPFYCYENFGNNKKIKISPNSQKKSICMSFDLVQSKKNPPCPVHSYSRFSPQPEASHVIMMFARPFAKYGGNVLHHVDAKNQAFLFR